MKKFSWGTGIVLILTVFFVVTGILLVIAFSHREDLVENNYYEKELAYQGKIDKQNNALTLKNPVAFSGAVNTLRIQFPIAETGPIKAGTVLFYKPSDSRSDFSIPLTVDSLGLFTYNMQGKPLGIWKAVVDWSAVGKQEKAYYTEKDFRLNTDGIGPY